MLKKININLATHLFAKIFTKIIRYKSVFLYNFIVSKLYMHNHVYSVYGVKLFDPDFKDNTFRFSCGGAYGDRFYNFLNKVKRDFAFLDVGSNIGIFSLIAAKNKSCKAIIAFEPNEKIYKRLVKNLINFSNPKFLYKMAISDKNTTKNFEINIISSGSSKITDKTKNSISVKTVNHEFLNSIFKNIDKDFIVKIDTEGHDIIVLKEIMKIKNVNFKYIYIEVLRGKSDIKEIEKILFDYSIVFQVKHNKKVKDILFAKKFN